MTHHVAIVAYDRLCTFEFGCAIELFALERPELGVRWYSHAVCAVEPGPLRAMGGLTLQVPHGLDALLAADTIVIPGWRDADEAPPPALVEALRAAQRRGARICSICSGAFVLAHAGLLDGRRATTHWRYLERLRMRFPAIAIDPAALYVDDSGIVTSAGSAAGLDMLLRTRSPACWTGYAKTSGPRIRWHRWRRRHAWGHVPSSAASRTAPACRRWPGW